MMSDMVRMEIIRPEFLDHLKVVTVHNSIRYTSTDEILKLFNDKEKVKLIREEARHQKLMALQRTEHSAGEDNDATDSYGHAVDDVGKRIDVGY